MVNTRQTSRIIDNPRNPMDSNTAPGNEIPAMDIDENPHIAEVTNPVNHDVAGTYMNNQVPNVANVVPPGMPSVVANSENQAIPIVPIGPTERPEQFKGQNFKRWQQKMLFFLTQLKLSRYLTEEEPIPEEGNAKSLASCQQ
ncbi:PREDICTED: uncharacterized protein LOC104818154 [Tarenaya hassleriana]|uniref:uncharacterized protein LOC104818154 n=1 Tax=Tarenaya hassleriana TaxID=28532 RepID=UPI0008FD2A50|nr:PREDICTED: uncharacterized protein LOC104818154 [Tarenaya hassleriana]